MKNEIFIKKKLEIDEYAYFYLKVEIMNKVLFFEITDYNINIIDVNEDIINKEYISLKEFINNAKYVGKIIKGTNDELLYTYNDSISIIKCGRDIYLDFYTKDILEGEIKYDLYDYKEIESYIYETVGEIIKDNYRYILEEIDVHFKKKDNLHNMLSSLNMPKLDKETFYKCILGIDKESDLNTLKKKTYSYLKELVENIKDEKLKNKMIDDALDAYNYLKKLSKTKVN